MREALARSDNDFVVYEEPRPVRRTAAAGKKSRGGVLAFLKRQPLRMFGLVVFGGVLVGIAVNATLFQTARHPAPLFAQPAEKPSLQKVAAATPVPAPRPAELSAASAAAPAARPVQQAALRPPMPLGKDQAEPANLRKGDPIAMLLRGDGQADAGSARTDAARRALQKVGFPVKGGDLRHAVERFEGDRGLPVTGKLAGRTLKELSAQSGVAIP